MTAAPAAPPITCLDPRPGTSYGLASLCGLLAAPRACSRAFLSPLPPRAGHGAAQHGAARRPACAPPRRALGYGAALRPPPARAGQLPRPRRLAAANPPGASLRRPCGSEGRAGAAAAAAAAAGRPEEEVEKKAQAGRASGVERAPQDARVEPAGDREGVIAPGGEGRRPLQKHGCLRLASLSGPSGSKGQRPELLRQKGHESRLGPRPALGPLPTVRIQCSSLPLSIKGGGVSLCEEAGLV